MEISPSRLGLVIAAVLEYLTAEIMKLVGNVARNNKTVRAQGHPPHLELLYGEFSFLAKNLTTLCWVILLHLRHVAEK